ncbi:hypothetical protein FRB93_004492 [Tulasnella sp. JGI-2019a]|nr:hypothetical protein FRB93_004492 [Tulasnella sp. JGI-2019a]
MADISLDTANFFGLLLSVWLYGLFPRMFLTSIWPLWNRRHRPGGKFVVAVTLCLFVTATSHIVINVAEGYDRFVMCRALPDGMVYSEAEYLPGGIIDGWVIVVAIWNVEIILIWRLWTVWSEDWRVVLPPIVLFTTEFVAGTLVCAQLGAGKAFDNPSRNGHNTGEIVASVCLLSVNMICTPLVIARLWWIGQRSEIQQTRSLHQTVIFRLVESGSLYTVTSLLWVIFHLPSGSAYPGVLAFVTYVFQAIITVAPMMIFQHLGQKIAAEALDLNISKPQSGKDTAQPDQPLSDVISTTIAFRPQSSATEP